MNNYLIRQNDGVELSDNGDGIGVISFNSKACAATQAVLSGIQQAIALAENKLTGIVIWQPNPKFFCVGADLPYVCQLVAANNQTALRTYLADFQATSLALRYSKIPVIAAVHGYALGGGCEISLHCAKIVAMQECHIGLVEAAIGLLPAGGGSKEMVLRASRSANYLENLQTYFLQVAQGLMSNSAQQAQDFNYLRSTDILVMTHEESLATAKNQFTNLAYTPPSSPMVPALGSTAYDKLITAYAEAVPNATEHDRWIAKHIASVFSGAGQMGNLTEQQWLDLELEAFLTLAMHPLTQARIKYTLETGKHLHN